MLYFGAALGGIGTGCVYGTCVGQRAEVVSGQARLGRRYHGGGLWRGSRADHRTDRYHDQFIRLRASILVFGLIQGGIVFVMAWLLLVPPAQLANAVVKPTQTAHGYTPAQVLRSPVFYVMYIMFVLIASGGLTMAASMAPIAKDLKIDKIPVELFGMAMPALGFALFLNRIFDGVGRPFFGWLSDQIGREYTMALAFFVGACALFT